MMITLDTPQTILCCTSPAWPSHPLGRPPLPRPAAATPAAAGRSSRHHHRLPRDSGSSRSHVCVGDAGR